MQSSIIIADDHPLMLRGLHDFLKSKGYNILGSGKDGQEAYNLIIKHKPNIAILDIRMPFLTGLEVAEECLKNGIKTKIILITFDKGEELYDKAQELNIFGYILKEFAIEEIEHCIESVTNNKPYFSAEIAQYLNSQTNTQRPHSLNELTKTEIKVLSLIAQNKTAKEIGNALSVSGRTIEKHKSNIIKKLNLESKHNSLSLFAKENEQFLES
ncbi:MULTISPECIES: response regulator transcription factor [Bizionia]|uniref:Response regulator transcription factor n=1 Tax=Bizionia algoritergicola TaxID=291187 RepID=A0A5D0R4D2_9FLAO|nr:MULTISPECIES: response regulator transcription factor [Bizionia]OBX23713.1 DNA-binding response regulator [Bizionia sp. APA-3]TYB75434.1 response regulator transcription factor [Bizionia algoritergicola]